jgi:hypothetical protein
MIVDRDRQSPDARVERRSFGHRPRPQHVTGLQAEVGVQRRRVMQLHDEARPGDHGPSMCRTSNGIGTSGHGSGSALA